MKKLMFLISLIPVLLKGQDGTTIDLLPGVPAGGLDGVSTEVFYLLDGSTDKKVSTYVLFKVIEDSVDIVQDALVDSSAALRAAIESMSGTQTYFVKRTHKSIGPRKYTLWPVNTGSAVTRLQLGDDPGNDNLFNYYFVNTGQSKFEDDIHIITDKLLWFGGSSVKDSSGYLIFDDNVGHFDMRDLNNLPSTLLDDWNLDANDKEMTITNNNYGFGIDPLTGITSISGQNGITIDAPYIYSNDSSNLNTIAVDKLYIDGTLMSTGDFTEAELLDGIENNKVLMRIGDSVGNSEMIISPGNYFQPQADIYNLSNLGPRIKTGLHTYSDYVPAYTFNGNDSSGWRGGATYSGIWYAQSKGSKLITYTPDSIYFHVPIKGNHGITGGTGGQDFSYLPDGAVPFESGDTLSGSANFNFNPATGLLSVLGVSVYNHSDGDYSFNTYVDSSGTGYYCTLDNEGIGMHIINEGPGVALKLQNNSSSPGDLIQIYEESTLKLKVDSTGQLFLHDSLKVPYLATDCEGWLLKTVTEGVGYDTISEGATRGLTDPLRPLAEVMTDTVNGEILWPYMTRKGEMDSTRTIKGLRPSEIFYLLQYAIENDRRYILDLEKENAELKSRMDNLEDRIKILEKLAAQ